MDFTRWSVRLALCLYLVATGILACRSRGGRFARWAWTLGCLCFLAHVAAAFHFAHGWSHAAAYQETARQTREIAGLDWGGGLYFNYAFTVAWVADVAWRWLERPRPRWLDLALHAFFAFMIFNATVVFETGAIRLLGLACTLSSLCLCVSVVKSHATKP